VAPVRDTAPLGRLRTFASPFPRPRGRANGRPWWRVLGLLVAGLALAVGAAACGEKSESQSAQLASRPFELALDWFPNPDHVAIYEALDQGYFEDVGLEVNPHTPSDPAAPIKQVAAGRVDLAISYEPEVFLARERGLPVVAVAALVQRPLTSLMAIGRKNVDSPADLRGKRVGTAGIPYQSAYLKTILKRAGVPASSVKETNVGASLLPAMLSGKVDATLAAFWNVEGVELRRRGQKPRIIPVDRLGVPDYDELVLVANEDALDRERDDLRLFIGALAKGAREARRDPRGAARALLEANRDLKPGLTRESVRVTLPALFPERSGEPWGYLDAAKWRNYGGWMRENGLLEELPDTSAALATDLLPGEGL
jgi:putative hydroxymethylpyrimidine transport system substrate-binding protein